MSVLLASSSQVLPESEGCPAQPGNLADLLLLAARRRPRSGLRLLSGAGGREATFLSYPALLNEARKILGGLLTYGRRPGTKVTLLLERPGDFIPAFWACVLGGYIPCPLVPIRSDPGGLAKHLARLDRLLGHPLLITTAGLGRHLPGGVIAADLDDLRTGTPAKSAYAAGPAEPAILVLTPGSADLKAVVLTHGNILASVAGKAQSQQLTANDVTLNWASFDDSFALLEGHLLPLHVGALQFHADPAPILDDPLLFLRLIERYSVSMACAPSVLFGQVNAALESVRCSASELPPFAFDLSSLWQIISGGEALAVETGRRFLDLLTPYGLARTALWPAFCMAETCAGSAYSREFPDGDAHREFASVGLPITGLQMRIVDERGDVLPHGHPGEVQLKGPMVFSRYYNNEEATRAAFTVDGWFRTGCRGRIEVGRLCLVGSGENGIISGINLSAFMSLKHVADQRAAPRAELGRAPSGKGNPHDGNPERHGNAYATMTGVKVSTSSRLAFSTTSSCWSQECQPKGRACTPKTNLGKYPCAARNSSKAMDCSRQGGGVGHSTGCRRRKTVMRCCNAGRSTDFETAQRRARRRCIRRTVE
jgi:acyl-CoA synthetase (AMP-forming)/AMP-acid ligase II